MHRLRPHPFEMTAISTHPQRLRRYRDIARLLVKYGRSDLVRQAGLEDALDPAAEVASTDDDAVPAEAEELTRDLEAMGPTFIKLGQLLSTRTDFVPPPYARALSRLQDDVEPFGYEEVERIVSEELGVRISKAFASFDSQPLASASLGQVHRAQMRDGRPVVVKVQRPGIKQRIAEDMEALGELAKLVDNHTEAGRRYGFADLLEQFRRSLGAELDYRREAANLNRLRAIVAPYPRLIVPKPIEDYTTGVVLTMEYIPSRKVTDLGPLGLLELDGAALAEELFKAYLDQILVAGFFHADPHPGNVLLSDDGDLVLLDLGMVARVPKAMREQLIKLLLSLSDANGTAAAETAIALGTPLEDFDPDRFCSQAAELVEISEGLSVAQIDAGSMVMNLLRTAADNGLRLPAELSLLGKALLNLDQVAHILDPDFEPAAAIKAHSAAIMQSQMKTSPGSAFSALLEARDFVEQLPGRVNKVMDALSGGEFHVDVKAFDEAEMLRGLQKLANRLTTGMVLAALILGAALLMRVPTSSKLFGYPSIAILCFLVATAGGFILLFSIMRSDHRVNQRTRKRKSSGRH
jgi:ubiquinone biosynthesis protein